MTLKRKLPNSMAKAIATALLVFMVPAMGGAMYVLGIYLPDFFKIGVSGFMVVYTGTFVFFGMRSHKCQ